VAEQVLVGLVEGQGGALQDRLDRARADARCEELSDELDRVTGRDAVSDREGDATAACRRGPKAPRGTSGGSSARVVAPQAGQRSRCSRCSLRSTAVGGSSAT